VLPGAGVTGTELIAEPDDGVQPLIKLIDGAQRIIMVEAYILSQHRIVRALERAANQGVDVYVLLDPHPFGLGPQPQRMYSSLQAAGVLVRWASPAFTYTHAKFLVLDDRIAIVATANLSEAAFHGNRELLVVDRHNTDVHDLSNVFRSDWDRIAYRNRDPDLILSPGSRPALRAVLQSARRSVDVYAEEVADPELDGLLKRLDGRIRVRVLVASGYSSRDLHRLSTHGVLVRRLVYPYVHAKALLVDGARGFIGSENLSPTSLDLNREVGVFVRGATIQRAEILFARDWRRATPFR
jgi:phosphatidylserine/phosphatidylglycerophosphate/cardiolipin synthase-like enzyme